MREYYYLCVVCLEVARSTFIKQHNLEQYTLSADAFKAVIFCSQMNSVAICVLINVLISLFGLGLCKY